MIEGADKVLKNKYKKKIVVEGEKRTEEKKWVTEEIRKERKERQRLNR